MSSIVVNYSSAQASCVAQSSVSSSAFNTANSNAAIIAHANTSATTSTTHFATANIDGSCVITAAPSLVIDVSASLSAFAVSISIGDKISVGHAQFTGSANLSSVAWVTGNAQATVTCSASVSSSAIAARIIPAEAYVSDSSYVVAGYDTWYDSWANQGQIYVASSSNYRFQAVPGIWPPTFQLTTYTSSLAPISQGNTGYQYRIGSMLSSGSYDTYYIDGVYYQGYWKNLERNTPYSVYTPPLTVYTGYTPNAQVVVSDVTILSGSFAYPSASADVTASGTRLALVSADVTSAATATAIAFTVRFIDASAAVNSEAGATSSASVDLFGSAQITATAQSTANGANETFATGSFSGSSLAISVGHKIAVGQTAIACSASLSATSNVERFTSATINANADLDAVGNTTVVLAGQMTASASANITTAPSLQVYVAATVSASATATADGDTLISATASVSDSSYVIPGYWIPAYDTYVDSLAAAYWVNFTNSQIQISGVYISIAPYYANTTYNGTNIPTTILNTLNYAAPAGTTYYNQLIQARTRSGVSGFDGAFKQRVTTTHPAVWVAPVTVYTGYAPSANVSAEAIILLSVSLSASGSVSAGGFISVFAEAAVSGSSITISAGTHSVVVRADAIASANLSADSSILRWASANLDPTASIGYFGTR